MKLLLYFFLLFTLCLPSSLSYGVNKCESLKPAFDLNKITNQVKELQKKIKTNFYNYTQRKITIQNQITNTTIQSALSKLNTLDQQIYRYYQQLVSHHGQYSFIAIYNNIRKKMNSANQVKQRLYQLLEPTHTRSLYQAEQNYKVTLTHAIQYMEKSNIHIISARKTASKNSDCFMQL